MRIFVDAMGGDYAPQAPVEGAIEALRRYPEIEVVLAGVIPEIELENRANIMLELDTFWAFNAGEDPIAWMKRLHSEGKLSVIHLKDGFKGGRGVALGEGEAPVAAVRALAEELGVTVVVESEGLDPTGREEVERCFRYLTK